MCVLGFSISATCSSAAVAFLRERLAPLAVLDVASEVQRVVQLHAEVVIFGARLQIEVRDGRVGGEVKYGNLAACWVKLLLYSSADAGCNARLTGRAVLGADGNDKKLFERVGSRVEPAQDERDGSRCCMR